jgi:hypothetical protein
MRHSRCCSCYYGAGDPSALLVDTDDLSGSNGTDGASAAAYGGSSGTRAASAVAAAIRSRQVAAASSAAGSGAGKVSLTEVRLQLQRQLKQQVRPFPGGLCIYMPQGFTF